MGLQNKALSERCSTQLQLLGPYNPWTPGSVLSGNLTDPRLVPAVGTRLILPVSYLTWLDVAGGAGGAGGEAGLVWSTGVLRRGVWRRFPHKCSSFLSGDFGRFVSTCSSSDSLRPRFGGEKQKE
jgi:hypothetical protein